MANSDKNIRITPNRNTNSFPKIVFTGQANDPITVNVLDDNSLSFSGSAGQLFSLSNNISSGTIFSVNDISGFPSFRINANGTVGIAEFSGNVGIGLQSPQSKLSVGGDINVGAGYTFRVAGTKVLDSSSLGTGVTGSSLTSVGTITSGVWAGTLITANYGGVGLTTPFTVGDILYANTSTTWGRLTTGTSGHLLSSTGTGSTPSYVNPITLTVGSATTASNLRIANANSNLSHPILFTPSSSTSGSAVSSDSTFSFNSSTEILSVSGLAITSGTSSTTTSTGALIVSGGVGVSGTLNTNRIKAISKITFEPGTGTSAVSGWTGFGMTSVSKLIFGGNRFVGVGGSFACYSDDGVNFSYTTIPGSSSSASYVDVAYGNGVFVAVNSEYVPFIAYSYDGAAWGTTSIPVGIIRTVGFGNGKFLAFSEAPSYIYSSTDGRNWSTIGNLGEYGHEVYFANGYFLSPRGNSLYYSADGISWKTANTPGNFIIKSITYGKGLYIAADYLSSQYFTSTDLVTWTPRSIPYKVWTGASYVNGVFYLIPNNDYSLYHSLDGINWSTTSFSTTIGGTNKMFTANDKLYFFSGWGSYLWSTEATTGTLMAKPFYNGEIENTRIGAIKPDSATFTNLTAFNPVTFTSTTPSTASDNGALVVFGGVGIGGTLSLAGRMNISSSFASTSTSTGALIVSGGVGIGGSLFVGNTLSVASSTASTSTTTGALIVSGGVGISNNLFVGGGVAFTSSIASTSTATGTLVVTGGVGIGGSVFTSTSNASSISGVVLSNGSVTLTGTYTQNNSSTTAFQVRDGSNNPAFVIDTIGDVISLPVAVASTSTSSGSLVVAGGVGIGGTLNARSVYVDNDLMHTPGVGNTFTNSWTSITFPSGFSASRIIYAENKFVAIGGSVVVYSSDLINWTTSYIPWTGALSCQAIAYGNGFFAVMPSQSAYVAYSSDLITWGIGSVTYQNYKSITYGNGKFIANSGAVVGISTNGTNWGSFTPSGNIGAGTISYHNGYFYTPSARSVDGINWESLNIPITIQQMQYGNGLYFGAQYNSANYTYSTDGLNFTLATIENNVYVGAEYHNGVYYLRTQHNVARLYYSFDGKNYQFVNTPGEINIYGMAFGKNKIAIVGFTGANAPFSYYAEGTNGKIDLNPIREGNIDNTVIGKRVPRPASFTDLSATGYVNIVNQAGSASTTSGALVVRGGVGIGQSVNIGGKLDVSNTINYVATNSGIANTWTRIAIPSPVSISGLTYGNGLYVGVGYSAATSTDGITWTARSLPHNLTTVKYVNNIYIGVNYGSALGATSSDGITWRSMPLPSSANWDGIAYGNGIYVITATYNNNLVAYSYNGFQWTLGSLPIPGGLGFFVTTPVIFGGGYFYTGSYSGVYYFTSVDGINWTLRTGLNNVATQNSCYGDGTWLLTGSSASLAYTKDLTNWTYGSHYGYSGNNNVGAYTNGTFAIVDFGSLQCTLIYKNLSTVVLSNLPGPSYATTITAGEGKFIAGAGSTVYVTDVASHTYNIFPHNSGDMNNVRIGDKFPSAAQFTNLSANSLVSFGATTPSISTSTGALVVKGGVGIGGSLFVGNTLSVASSTASTSTTTGSLVVAGGVGIGGSVNVGGRVGIGTNLLSGQLNIRTSTSTTPGIVVQGSASQTADYAQFFTSTGSTSLSITKDAEIKFPLAQDVKLYATAYGSVGAIKTTGNFFAYGGLIFAYGVSDELSAELSPTRLYVSGLNWSTYSSGSSIRWSTNNAVRIQPTSTSVVPLVVQNQSASWTSGNAFEIQNNGVLKFNVDYAGNTSILSTAGSASTTTGALVVTGGVGIGQSVIVGGDIIINGGRESNSTSTGSLIVRGGAGITGGLYVKPFSLSTKGLVVQANTSQSGNLLEFQSPDSSTLTSFNASGELNITSTTGSTSSSFGSIVTAGGVGIGGSVSIGSTAGSSSTTSGALKVVGGVGIGGSINIGGRVGIGTNLLDATLNIRTSTAATPGIVIQGSTSQSASLFRVNSSLGGSFFEITNSGIVNIKTSTAGDFNSVPLQRWYNDSNSIVGVMQKGGFFYTGNGLGYVDDAGTQTLIHQWVPAGSYYITNWSQRMANGSLILFASAAGGEIYVGSDSNGSLTFSSGGTYTNNTMVKLRDPNYGTNQALLGIVTQDGLYTRSQLFSYGNLSINMAFAGSAATDWDTTNVIRANIYTKTKYLGNLAILAVDDTNRFVVGPYGNTTVSLGGTTASTGFIIKAASSQTGNLFEAQSSTGATLTFIDASGNASIGGTLNVSGSNSYFQNNLYVGNNTQGRLYFSQATLGSAGTTVIPSMAFIGSTNSPITLSVLPDNSLSFDGSSGQLFSINNNLSTGWIFSISDISGLPLFRTNADGTVSMGEFGGNVGIGLTNPTYKLQVAGNAGIANTLFVSGNAHFGSTAFSDIFIGSYLPGATLTNNYAGDMVLQVQNKSNDLTARTGLLLFNDTNDYTALFMNSSNYAGTGLSNVELYASRPLVLNSYSVDISISSAPKISARDTTITITPATESTSSSTGSLIVSGGAGIAKSLNVGGYLSSKPAYATAGLAATQTLTSGADNLILFTDNSDPNAWWTGVAGSGVSHRFKPNIAGLYFVSAQVHFLQGTGSGQMYIQARKNGNTFSLSRAEVVTNANGLTLNLSGTTSLDGNTDYIDFAVFTAGTQNIHGEADRAWSQTTIYKIF